MKKVFSDELSFCTTVKSSSQVPLLEGSTSQGFFSWLISRKFNLKMMIIYKIFFQNSVHTRGVKYNMLKNSVLIIHTVWWWIVWSIYAYPTVFNWSANNSEKSAFKPKYWFILGLYLQFITVISESKTIEPFKSVFDTPYSSVLPNRSVSAMNII